MSQNSGFVGSQSHRASQLQFRMHMGPLQSKVVCGPFLSGPSFIPTCTHVITCDTITRTRTHTHTHTRAHTHTQAHAHTHAHVSLSHTHTRMKPSLGGVRTRYLKRKAKEVCTYSNRTFSNQSFSGLPDVAINLERNEATEKLLLIYFDQVHRPIPPNYCHIVSIRCVRMHVTSNTCGIPVGYR